MLEYILGIVIYILSPTKGFVFQHPIILNAIDVILHSTLLAAHTRTQENFITDSPRNSSEYHQLQANAFGLKYGMV